MVRRVIRCSRLSWSIPPLNGEGGLSGAKAGWGDRSSKCPHPPADLLRAPAVTLPARGRDGASLRTTSLRGVHP